MKWINQFCNFAWGDRHEPEFGYWAGWVCNQAVGHEGSHVSWTGQIWNGEPEWTGP